jgi:hypothetical protein
MSEPETVQSDVTFSVSYVKRPLELGKLMLYQLSYSRSPLNRITRGRVGFPQALIAEASIELVMT